jgi:hypothetical protein
MQSDFSHIGPLLLAAVVMFAVYRRLRRTFGRQLLRPRRMVFRIALLTVVGCALMPLALRSAQFLTAELSGAVLGVALAIWGAERTRFLKYNGQLHFMPHTYTGIIVSLLFLGRLVFRLVQVYSGAGHAPHSGDAAEPSQAFSSGSAIQSPLTVGLFFVLVGYYVCYYSLVLWKSKHLKPDDIEVVSAAAVQ